MPTAIAAVGLISNFIVRQQQVRGFPFLAAQDFVAGRVYNRRRDIHERYGGQPQGGISTPAKHPVIFAFTGASGARHGYVDEWTADGALRYFGEG